MFVFLVRFFKYIRCGHGLISKRMHGNAEIRFPCFGNAIFIGRFRMAGPAAGFGRIGSSLKNLYKPSSGRFQEACGFSYRYFCISSFQKGIHQVSRFYLFRFSLLPPCCFLSCRITLMLLDLTSASVHPQAATTGMPGGACPSLSLIATFICALSIRRN